MPAADDKKERTAPKASPLYLPSIHSQPALRSLPSVALSSVWSNPRIALLGQSGKSGPRRHNRRVFIDFGASAPQACPQKTGTTRASPNEPCSGSRLQFEWKACGCTGLVSGPRCGVRSRRWKAPWGPGFKGQDSTLARLSPNRRLAGCPLGPELLN